MIGYGFLNQRAVEYERSMKAWGEEMERLRYDLRMRRGPMIEADIDWRAPNPKREMRDGDL